MRLSRGNLGRRWRAAEAKAAELLEDLGISAMLVCGPIRVDISKAEDFLKGLSEARCVNLIRLRERAVNIEHYECHGACK